MTEETRDQTIAAEALEKLTGLTDRRHRQIAKLGYFPSPKNGVYKLIPTLKGMFVYYRGLNQNEGRQLKLVEEHRKLKIINDRMDGKLVAKQELVTALQACCTRQLAILRQRLENEYPSAVAGLDVPQARVYGKRLVVEICKEMQELEDEWKF